MGVLTCNKKGCDNIMCNTYMFDVGYICGECIEEFTKYVQFYKMSKDKFKIGLQCFVDIRKGFYSVLEEKPFDSDVEYFIKENSL